MMLELTIVIGVEQDQRYRAHPLSTVAVIPHHPDFVYPDPNIEIIVRSEGQRLSRSAKRYIRRVQYQPNEGYETPSYRLPSELPGGTFRRSNTLRLTFIPDTISQQVVERARGLRFGQSSSPIIGSRAPTQSMRGNHQSSDIIPPIHVSSHRLAYITTINAPHQGHSRISSSHRTTGYRTPAHPAPAVGGYHPSTIISPTAPAGSWAQIVAWTNTRRHTTSSAERMARARHESPTSSSNRSTTTPAGSSADIAALERTWDLASPPDPASSVDDSTTDSAFDTATPDSSDLAGTARHAARLLDAFSRTSLPPVVVGITTVQKRLLTTVLTSVLTLTREARVQAALANESLEALPVAEDVALRPDSACVVCYARLAEMVLMPCWHLTLCEVWIPPVCYCCRC